MPPLTLRPPLTCAIAPVVPPLLLGVDGSTSAVLTWVRDSGDWNPEGAYTSPYKLSRPDAVIAESADAAEFRHHLDLFKRCVHATPQSTLSWYTSCTTRPLDACGRNPRGQDGTSIPLLPSDSSFLVFSSLHTPRFFI